MFCYQCQETMSGRGCNKKVGVCGKTADVAVLQDLLIYYVKKLSAVVVERNIGAKELGDINKEMVKALFMTITNANFDDKAIIEDDIRDFVTK